MLNYQSVKKWANHHAKRLYESKLLTKEESASEFEKWMRETNQMIGKEPEAIQSLYGISLVQALSAYYIYYQEGKVGSSQQERANELSFKSYRKIEEMLSDNKAGMRNCYEEV